jgi:hypothetical protein
MGVKVFTKIGDLSGQGDRQGLNILVIAIGVHSDFNLLSEKFLVGLFQTVESQGDMKMSWEFRKARWDGWRLFVQRNPEDAFLPL